MSDDRPLPACLETIQRRLDALRTVYGTMPVTRADHYEYDMEFEAAIGELQQVLADVRAAWQAQEGGWQPIATAPKDGTQILLYGRWNKTRDLFGSGAWRSFNDGDTAQWSWGWTLEPSHWMPLPAPPAAAEP